METHHAEKPPACMAVSAILSLIGTGAQQLSLDNQTANTGLFGPASGSATTPTFRAMVATDIPADAIDDTKLGDRAPQFYRRQGGNATNWDEPGTTTRTPGAVRMQGGAISADGNDASVTITFPTSFSAPPLVLISVQHWSSNDTAHGEYRVTVNPEEVEPNQFMIDIEELTAPTGGARDFTIHCRAIA